MSESVSIFTARRVSGAGPGLGAGVARGEYGALQAGNPSEVGATGGGSPGARACGSSWRAGERRPREPCARP